MKTPEKKQAVKRSHPDQQTLLDATPFGMMIVDREKKVRYLNQAAVSLLGYPSSDEILGTFCYEKVCTAGCDDCPILDLGMPLSHEEKWVRHINGHLVPVIKTVVPVTLAGEELLLEGLVDISQLRETEKALETSEHNYRVLTESSPDAVFSFNRDFILQYVNEAGARFFRDSKEKLPGKSMYELFPPRLAERQRLALERVFSTGKPENQIGKVAFPNMEIWLDTTLSPVFGQDGSVQLVMGVSRDITHTRQIETEIRQINKGIEGSSDAIGMSDATGRHFYHNKAFTRMFGYTVEELSQVYGPVRLYKDPGKGKEVFDTITNGKAWTGEVEMVSKDGHVMTVNLRADAVMDGAGTILSLIGIHTDITDQLQAKKQIEASEKRWSDLFNLSRSAIAIYEPTEDCSGFLFREMNDSGLRMEGVTREKIIGKSVEEVFPGIEEMGLLDIFKRVCKTGKGERHDISFYSDDRISGWRENYIFKLNSGEIVAMYDDVTPLKQAEADLRQSKAFIESILNASPDLIYIYDLVNRKNVYVNNGIQVILGYTDEEIKEMGDTLIPALMYPDDFQYYLANTVPRYASTSDHEVVDHQYRMKHKDGSWRLLDCRETIFLRQEDGTPKQIFGILQDITQEKKAENELNLFFNLTLEMLCIAGTDGYFRRLNPMFSKVLGYTDEELKAIPFLDFIHPDDLQPTLDKISELASGKKVINFINRYRRKDGSYRWFSWLSSPMEDTIYAAASDITELKKKEDELKRLLEEVQQSNRELEQFAYVASHDLQEPLRMVSSYTQLLERRYKDKLDQDATDFIRYAVDGANRMQRLINDLLDFSRVTTRGEDFGKKDASEILRQALENLDQKVKTTGAEIVKQDLPFIYGDETQLVRLFQNLIDNALKYRTKETPRIEIGYRRDGECYEFFVKDNGIGFDPQFSDRIFQIFQRLHPQGEYSGTGIGLAICKRIIERHGGRIWVDSEPGKGSTFFFTLRIQKV